MPLQRPTVDIIVGSTRPGRNAEAVAHWAAAIAAARYDALFELVDTADYDLPLLDEPLSALATARVGLEYRQPHTKAWSDRIAGDDGFVVVTPEYDFRHSGVAEELDRLPAPGMERQGGGVRTVGQLRHVMAELQVATVVPEVSLQRLTDFENYTDFKPAEARAGQSDAMLDKLVAWSVARMTVRAGV